MIDTGSKEKGLFGVEACRLESVCEVDGRQPTSSTCFPRCHFLFLSPFNSTLSKKKPLTARLSKKYNLKRAAMTTTMSKARKRITLLLALLALLALSSSSSSLASAQEQQGDGFFDAAAAGDFEPDIAGEPLAPLAPAVIDEEEGEGPAAAPAPAPAVKKPAAARAPAPAPAAAAATKKKEEEPKPAAAAPAKKEAASSSNALPYADLLYTVLARRATFDPRSRKLTLEGVFPIVAAVKVGRGDGRGPTSLRGEGKDRDRECSALVAKTARRSSATRFFGDTFRRNGEFFFFFFFFFFFKIWTGARGREGEREKRLLSPPFFSPFFLERKNTLLTQKKNNRDLAQLPDRPPDGHRLLPRRRRARPAAVRRAVPPLGVDRRLPRRADRPDDGREGEQGGREIFVAVAAALVGRRRRVVGRPRGGPRREVAGPERKQGGPPGRAAGRRRSLLEAGAPAERV